MCNADCLCGMLNADERKGDCNKRANNVVVRIAVAIIDGVPITVRRSTIFRVGKGVVDESTGLRLKILFEDD